MCKKSFKLSSVIAAVALAFASSAFATPPAPPTGSYSSAAGSGGHISSTASSYASVNGDGSSVSHSGVQAGSFGATTVNANPTSAGFTGAVSGYVDAQAYNVSTGAGSGMATAYGGSEAAMAGGAAIFNPSGMMNGAGDVRGDTSAMVFAGRSQDGYAGGSYEGAVTFNGTVNGVQSTLSTDAQAYAGRITFSGGAPAGQTGASIRSANADATGYTVGTYMNGAGVVGHVHTGNTGGDD